MPRQLRNGCAAAVLLLVTACDIVVRQDETLVLGNRGSVFGSSGFASAGLPAVTVMRFGTAVVQDADLFGGLAFLNTPESGSSGGPGIEVNQGTVRIVQGTIRGGSVIGVVPPIQPPNRGAGAPAIRADVSMVQVSGGVLIGGSVTSLDEGTARVFSGAAIQAIGSTVQITGGRFVPGTVEGVEASASVSPAPAILVSQSRLEISGGRFEGDVTVFESQARIRGGRVESLSVGAFGSDVACVEIRGGEVLRIRPFGGRAFVFGTDFQQSFGNQTRLTGRFEDGSPIDVLIDAIGSGTVFIAAPGSAAGCPQASL